MVRVPSTLTVTRVLVLLIALSLPTAAGAQPVPYRIDVVGRNASGLGWAIAGSRLLVFAAAGQSWRDATPPGATPSEALHATFVDDRTGWAVTSLPSIDGFPRLRVFRSADAGTTWDAGDVAHGVDEVASVRVAAVSASHAWVLLRRVSSSNFSDGTLMRTIDAGRTWEPLPRPPIAGDIRFGDAGVGWIVGGPSGHEVYETRDAGTSWTSMHDVLAPHLPAAGDVSLALPTLERDGIRIVAAFDSATGRETRLLTRAAGVTGLQVRTLRRIVRGATPRAGEGTATVAAAVRELLAGSPLAGAWSARGVVLSDRDVAAQVEAISPRDAWVLLREGRCAAAKRDCSQKLTLLATVDDGGTMKDITPTGAPPDARPASSPRDVALSDSRGFDKCTAASVSSLQTWWNESPYRDVNVYIGGVSRGCSQPLLTAAWVRDVFATGWRLIPTWVGYQAPCTSCSTCRNRFSTDPSEAEAEGVREADRATDVAGTLGLGTQTVIYFDLEAYASTDRACRDAVSAFVNGWSRRLRERGHVAGVYGSATNASQDWTGIQHRPDAVWIAKWDLRETVWGLTPLSDAEWSNRQRLHQYRGGHDETWGGVAFNIDNDIEDGPVAAPEGATAPDTTGPELAITSPRPGDAVGALVVVSGTASDAGRGSSGISSVVVNGVRAESGDVRGSDVAYWRAEIALGAGEQEISVEARDASPARTATRASVRVVVENGGPTPPTPPPAPVGPTVLATALTDPRALVLDGVHAWWIDAPGRLGRSALDGTGTVLVSESLDGPTALARGDDGAIYVADGRGILRFAAQGDQRPPPRDGVLIVESESPVSSLVVVGDALVFADAGRGEIRRVGIRGGEVAVIAAESPAPTSLRVFEGRLYWVELTSPGAIRTALLDGNEAARLADGANTPALSVAGWQIAWGVVGEDGVSGGLRHVAVAGGEPATLVDGVRRPWDIARAGASLYWVEAVSGGALWRAAADGTAAERLTHGLNEPIAVAVTGGRAVVIERAGGEPGGGRLIAVDVSPGTSSLR